MILPILLAAAQSHAAPSVPAADSPRAFVERLYAGYRNSDYSPFTHAGRVFAPRLAAAIAEDSRLNRGEVGYVDADPICQCQDTEGMRASIAQVTAQGRDAASVRVMLHWSGSAPGPLRLSLVRTRAGWRVADISSSDEPSFLRGLEAANRQAHARRH